MKLVNHSKVKKHLGFTLIELMVAIAVMAILAVLSWRGLEGMALAQKQTQTQTDDILTLQAGLAQWQADLDALWEIPQMPNINALDYDGRVLRLLRRFTEKDTDSLRVVAWSQRAINGKVHWLRWQSDRVKTRSELLSAWLLAAQWSQTPNEATKKNEVIVAAIDQWQIFYNRDKAWSNAQSSADEVLAASQQMTLPHGIRLELTLSKGQALEGLITRDWVRPTLGGEI